MNLDVLKGLRTIIIGLLMAVLPVVTQYLGMIDWSTVLPPPYSWLVSGIVMILLRLITTGPVGKK